MAATFAGAAKLKLTAALAALIVGSVATAQAANPVLIGKTVRDSRSSGRIVVCKYAEAHVRYEIVSNDGNCSASLNLPAVSGDLRAATLQPAAAK